MLRVQDNAARQSSVCRQPCISRHDHKPWRHKANEDSGDSGSGGKAKKINIRRDGRDYTISNIQGTHLGNAGNLVDMLKWTPGITVSRNGQEETFNVFGRGEADVYVNGRKVKTSAELRGQKSNLVTKIEIIRDPDVQYSGSTKAVIRISTRRPVEDYMGDPCTIERQLTEKRETARHLT